MPASCSAFGCKNIFKTGGTVQFFGFPLKNEHLLKTWVVKLRRKDFTPTKSSKICSDHFNEIDYLVRPGTYVRKLKPDAIPTIFPAFPSVNNLQQRDSSQIVLKRNTSGHSNKNTLDTVGSLESSSNVGIEHNKTVCDEVVQKIITSVQSNEEHVMEINDALESSREGRISPKPVLELEQQLSEPLLVHKEVQSELLLVHKEVQTDEDQVQKVLKLQVKTLCQKIRRRNKSITNLKNVMKRLRKKGLLQQEAKNLLEQQFEGTALEVFRNVSKNFRKKANGVRYSQEMKQFAITLNYHSPKAYEYCRNIFCLPHKSSLTNWTSSVNAEPGFFKEVFTALSNFELADRDCNLVLDGMAIRKQLIWDGKLGKFIGHCDFGETLHLESEENLATEALVFMLVSINGKWKWPIGYFMQTKSNALVQAELIKTAIIIASEAGLRIWGVTCDGTTTNFATFHHLGCQVSGYFSNIKSFFMHPNRDQEICFIPDACHMIKLARNALGTYKQFKTDEGLVEWRYIENLNEFQANIGLKLANKLSNTHVDWKKNIMKVKLAAQTFSSSTADALDFLNSLGFEQFQNCEETVKFIRCVDRIFDFLNSRSPFGKGYKKPIYTNNIEFLKMSVAPLIQYLYTLKDNKGNYLYTGPRRTFVIGFATAVSSIFRISENLLPNSQHFKYLLTYKFSQDHIELLFSRVRKRFGFNNNPNVQQFKTAMKQILLKNQITPSAAANCLALDLNSVGSVFDIKWAKKVLPNTDNETLLSGDEDIEILFSNLNFDNDSNLYTEAKENILYYIGGFIVRGLLKKISCNSCAENLVCLTSEHNYGHKFKFSLLTDVKDRGGLISPSESVFKIIKGTEMEVNILTNNFKTLSNKNIKRKIINIIINYFATENNIFSQLSCEISLDSNHKIDLIVYICERYLKIRLHSIANLSNQRETAVSKRHKLNKLILFSNQ